MKMAIRN